MFEEVGHAGAVSALVLGTNVVQHGDGDKWDGVVLVKDDVEAVVQIEFGELDLARLGWPQAADEAKAARGTRGR